MGFARSAVLWHLFRSALCEYKALCCCLPTYAVPGHGALVCIRAHVWPLCSVAYCLGVVWRGLLSVVNSQAHRVCACPEACRLVANAASLSFSAQRFEA